MLLKNKLDVIIYRKNPLDFLNNLTFVLKIKANQMRFKIFISSVQSEFSRERRLLADYLSKDTLFRKFFDVFIFEDLPAKDQNPQAAYIDEVKQCDIFILLLGREYGFEFSDGTSPTQQEFETASKNNKYRLAFVSNHNETERDPKTNSLIRQVSDCVIYNIFSSPSELLSNVYSSLINFLAEKGELRNEPFDKSPNRDAELEDLSDEKIEWFVRRARAERNFPLTIEDGKEKILTHLNLLNKGKISNAAVLLFGKQPQRFFLTSEVKCAHFHGNDVQKPIPFYQVYKGNLFELVDQAVDFVLSKIDLAVGTRKRSIEVPTAYEIPVDVIKEAIVNAVAHRDYDSTASVQVMLFRNRLEVWNPGTLPPQLSIETLKENHGSYPRNPLIADALYYTHYIERMGTGIEDIVKKCLDFGLPEPQFKMRDGFVSTIYRKQGIAFEKVIEESGEKNDTVDAPVDAPVDKLWERLVYIIRDDELTRVDIMQKLKLEHKQNFLKNYLQPALKLGLIEMTIPDKPNSRLQKYRLTQKGIELKNTIIANK
jgi:predicted HTH transcriptional regulator